MAAHRKWRQGRYEQLLDAVYARRGWTPQGVPTYARIKELGIDFPEVLEVVKPFLG
jgi:aldehyde:ferredoxin oxidoreductase